MSSVELCVAQQRWLPRFPSSDKRGSATTGLSLQAPAKEGDAGGALLHFEIFLDNDLHGQRPVKKGLLVHWKMGEVGLKLKQQQRRQWIGPTPVGPGWLRTSGPA